MRVAGSTAGGWAAEEHGLRVFLVVAHKLHKLTAATHKDGVGCKRGDKQPEHCDRTYIKHAIAVNGKQRKVCLANVEEPARCVGVDS